MSNRTVAATYGPPSPPRPHSHHTKTLLCSRAASEMGKPQLNDLRSGLATAPVLYAAEEHPDLLPLIQRRFKEARRARGTSVCRPHLLFACAPPRYGPSLRWPRMPARAAAAGVVATRKTCTWLARGAPGCRLFQLLDSPALLTCPVFWPNALA